MHRPGRAAPVLLTRAPRPCERRCEEMIKWNYRATRVALVLGALAAFAVSSGAQTKWM